VRGPPPRRDRAPFVSAVDLFRVGARFVGVTARVGIGVHETGGDMYIGIGTLILIILILILVF
jgi:hypothetical protein